MRIAFYTPHMCLRGTTVALFDYAKYNEIILGNESYIFTDKQHDFHDHSVFEKFETQFPGRVVRVENEESLDPAIIAEKIDAIYIIKPGRKSKRMASACKTLIHVIGPTDPSEKHGDVWAYASHWLNNHCAEGNELVVPYMIEPPVDTKTNLRKELGIPEDAIVIGRTGGKETFDIPQVYPVMGKILHTPEHSNIFFLFQNTFLAADNREIFKRYAGQDYNLDINHPRIIHVKSTADMSYKEAFINSCDAMLHARYVGESFGVACGEFGIRGKPVITWDGSYERNHLEVLGNKALLYNNATSMYNQITSIFQHSGNEFTTYQEYTPEIVMKSFKEVFLD